VFGNLFRTTTGLLKVVCKGRSRLQHTPLPYFFVVVFLGRPISLAPALTRRVRNHRLGRGPPEQIRQGRRAIVLLGLVLLGALWGGWLRNFGDRVVAAGEGIGVVNVEASRGSKVLAGYG
jgi:hypothetical protein